MDLLTLSVLQSVEELKLFCWAPLLSAGLKIMLLILCSMGKKQTMLHPSSGSFLGCQSEFASVTRLSYHSRLFSQSCLSIPVWVIGALSPKSFSYSTYAALLSVPCNRQQKFKWCSFLGLIKNSLPIVLQTVYVRNFQIPASKPIFF